jgi:hypothetical protein
MQNYLVGSAISFALLASSFYAWNPIMHLW